jgi:hypothetical protein
MLYGCNPGYDEDLSELKTVADKCFSNCDVRLDGYDYIGCSFQSCRFVYSGKKDFNLIGNHVSPDCDLIFEDRAANTISAMTDLHDLGEWGQACVIAALGEFAELASANQSSGTR